MATPGAPLAPPWAPLTPRLRPFMQSVVHGCYFGCQGRRAGAPRAWKCAKTHKIPMFCEGAHLEPKVPKRLPPGCPGTCFGPLLELLLEHLGVLSPPVATLRPHFDTAVDESVYLCVFAAFWLHPGPQLTCKPGQQWNGKHSGKTFMRGHSKGTGSAFFFFCLLCFCPFFKPEGLDSKLEGKIQA